MERGRPVKCPFCAVAGRSVKKGHRRTKTMGKRRIRLCRACGKKFTPKNQKPVESDGTDREQPDSEPDQVDDLADEEIRTLPEPREEWTS